MKKILYLAIIIISIFVVWSVSFAEGSEISIAVNGVQQTFEQKPIIKDGRTLVPLRAISETLGAVVNFVQKVKGILVYNNRKALAFCIDGSEIYFYNIKAKEDSDDFETIDSTAKIMDTLPTIIDGRTYVPLRIISEGLGAEIKWTSETRTIDITYPYIGEKIMRNGTPAEAEYENIFPKANVTPTPSPTPVITQKPSPHEPIPGFKTIEVDGFKLQLPIGRSDIGSKIKYSLNGSEDSFSSTKYPVEKNYEICYKSSEGDHCKINFYISSDVKPWFTLSSDVTNYPSTIRNADTAYVSKNYNDNMQERSDYTVMAVRGNICYFLEVVFEGDVHEDSRRENKEFYKKFLDDGDKIASSFELSDIPVTYNEILNSKGMYMPLEE